MKTYTVSNITKKNDGYSFQAIHNKNSSVQIWTLTEENKIFRHFVGSVRDETDGVYLCHAHGFRRLDLLRSSFLNYNEKD